MISDEHAAADVRTAAAADDVTLGARVALSALAFSTIGAVYAVYVAYRGEMYQRLQDAPVLSIYSAVLFALFGAVYGLAAHRLHLAARPIAAGACGPCRKAFARRRDGALGVLDSAYRNGIYFLAALALSSDAIRRYGVQLDPLPWRGFAREMAFIFGVALAARTVARLCLARPRPFHRSLAAVALALLGGASLASIGAEGRDGAGGRPGGGGPVPNRLPPEERPRVLVIGIDAGDWGIFDPLMESGRMPALRSLVLRGVRSPLPSDPPFISASVWTTISTGTWRGSHGVVDHLSCIVPGISPFQPERLFEDPLSLPGPLLSAPFLMTGGYQAVPVRADAVRMPTVWEDAALGGSSLRVVGWPVTWPASAFGFPGETHEIVSERFFRSSWEAFYEYDPNLPDTTRPTSLAGPLRAAHRALLLDAPWDEIQTILPLTAEEQARAAHLHPTFAWIDPPTLVALSYIGDRCRTDVLLDRMAAAGPRDLTATFFDGMDLVGHAYWQYRVPEEFPETPPADAERFHDVVDRYAEFVDREIGRVLDTAVDERTVVVLCSDHGVVSCHWNPVWKGWHGPTGIFLIAGPGVRRGVRIDSAHLVDIAPTILHVLGLPPGREMAGRPLFEALE